jgi:hypothetical protein
MTDCDNSGSSVVWIYDIWVAFLKH